jgi:hypothetical protein
VDKFLTSDGYCQYSLKNLVEGKRQCKVRAGGWGLAAGARKCGRGWGGGWRLDSRWW